MAACLRSFLRLHLKEDANALKHARTVANIQALVACHQLDLVRGLKEIAHNVYVHLSSTSAAARTLGQR